jgi:peroxiredoxin
MRKLDLLAILLFVTALVGAALCYEGFLLAGQIVYTVALLGIFLLTKTLAAPLQIWIALIICIGFGGTTGDWFLSIAVTSAFLAINLRGFIFRRQIYSKALIIDPLLGVLGVAVYLTTNIFHHAQWQGWTLPAFFIILGLAVSIQVYFDRKQVEKISAQGFIEAGTPAPDFSLENFDGQKISLYDYKDKRDVLLIFVRGDWCPGCHIMLRLYERERKKFQDKNVMLFAIGPDPVGVNKAMVEKLGLEFAVLSDDTMEVSRKFCVRLQEEGPGKNFDHGIPLPASFLVDKKGIVRYTSRADRAGEFLSPDLIFDILEKL